MAATNINRVIMTGNLTPIPSCARCRAAPRSASCASRATRAARTTRRASGSTSPTTSTSPSGARRARTAPATSPRAARSRSTAASSGASGRTRTATTARRSRSSPTRPVPRRPRRRRRRQRRRQRLHRRAPTSPSTRATSRRARGGGGGGGRQRRATTTSRSSRGRSPDRRPPQDLAPRATLGARSSTPRAVRTQAPRTCHNVWSRAARARVRCRLWTEDFQVAKQRKRQARAAAGQEGRSRQRAAQALPVLQGQDRAGRLQGRRHAAAVHLRARQDPLAPHHRRLPPPPEPDRPGGQARPRARAPALRQRDAPRESAAAVAAAATAAIATGTASRARGNPPPGRREPRRAGATVVDVSKGYLRNYLIPRKLAQPATKGALEAAERRSRPRSAPPASAVERAQENADAAQQDRPDDPAAGRRGRPPVRLGHQPGHRRRDPRRPRHHGRQAQGPPRGRRSSHVGTYMVVVEVDDGVTATVKTMVTEPRRTARTPARAASAAGAASHLCRLCASLQRNTRHFRGRDLRPAGARG